MTSLVLPMEIWCIVLKFCKGFEDRKNLSQTCSTLYYQLLKKEKKAKFLSTKYGKIEVYRRYGYKYNCNSTEENKLPCTINYNLNKERISEKFAFKKNTITETLASIDFFEGVNKNKVKQKMWYKTNYKRVEKFNQDGQLKEEVIKCNGKQVILIYQQGPHLSGKIREKRNYDSFVTRECAGKIVQMPILHNKDAPAVVRYYTTGEVWQEMWYENNHMVKSMTYYGNVTVEKLYADRRLIITNRYCNGILMNI